MLHRDEGFLLAQARCESVVAGPEVGGVFGAGGAHRGGAQRGIEPAVAVSSLPGLAFAGGFVVPGAQSRPRRQVPGSAKAGHVATCFGDDHLSGGRADPGDGLQQVKLVGERAHLFLDPRREFQDRRGELINAFEMYPAQAGEDPRSAGPCWGSLATPPAGSIVS